VQSELSKKPFVSITIIPHVGTIVKVDETIESVGRVWQQVTILIILHLIFLLCAILAGVTSIRSIENTMHGAENAQVWRSLKEFHSNLKTIGLELPVVAGLLGVVYMITFQRLSSVLAQIPPFRLKYSEPALWRSGKRFHELRQLFHYSERYMISPELDDLQVTLDLAIAQFGKDFKEHYSELVGSRIENAKTWSTYSSGLSLLLLFSIPIFLSSTLSVRAFILPVGLLLCILAARCGWEIQIEHLVLGRLRFALDSAAISNERIIREETISKDRAGRAPGESGFEQIAIFSRAAIDDLLWAGKLHHELADDARLTQAYSVLLDDLDLARALMKSTRERRVREIWLLNYLRLVWRVTIIGPLAPIPNRQFLDWLHHRLAHDYFRYIIEESRRRLNLHLLDPIRQQRLLMVSNDSIEVLLDYHPEERFNEPWVSGNSIEEWVKNPPTAFKE
jgi:hypothetical protein